MLRHAHEHKQPRARLSLERLEDRWAPAAGGLDPSFGTGGVTTTSFGTEGDDGSAVAIDDLGRIVAVGHAVLSVSPIVMDFAVARYNADGILDNTFDGDGKTTTAIGPGDDIATSVAIDQVGRIVVGGYSTIGGAHEFALVRYNLDGTLDTSFGTGGKVIESIGASSDECYGLAIDGSGRIVAVGSTYNPISDNRDFAVARFNMNGSLDNSFGTGGKVVTPMGSGNEEAFDVAIDALGRIVVAGSSSFAVARYNADGNLDSSFGTGGKAITSFGSNYVARSLAIDTSGRIVVAGGDEDFAVVRFGTDGKLDTSFGLGGRVFTHIGTSVAHAYSVAIDGLGRIVVAGWASGSSHDDVAVVRYSTDGSLDASFGFEGKVLRPLTPSTNEGHGVLIDGLGRIVVAGQGYSGAGSDFLVARYLAENFRIIPQTTVLAYTEDDGVRVLDNLLALADSPNPALVSATVRIDNYLRGEDVLGYSLQGGISGSFDPIASVLTLSNPAPIADYQAVLRSLTYTNTSQQPVELSRSITVTVDDGEENDNLASATYTIHVLGRNDAPSLSDDAVLPAILQGTDEPPGRKVSSLFAGLFIDPDGDNLGGVAVVGNTADAVTQGTWQYSTDAGASWFDVGDVGEGAAALALSAATRLRFKAVAAFSGEPTPLVLRAIDSTFPGPYSAGAAREFIDTGTNGGTSLLAAGTNSVVTSVFPVAPVDNTPPTLLGVPFSANLNEGQTLSFTASATDPDAGQFLSFGLAGAPTGASIDPDSGFFTWTPTEAQGPNIFVFAVRVTDGFAVTQQTVTAIVGEVNAAPDLAGVPATASLVKGQSLSFTATATDADLVAGMPNTLMYSLVGAPPGAAIDPNTGVFTWTPPDHLPPGSYSFNVQVTDDGVPSRNDTQAVSVSLVAAGLVAGDLVITGTPGNDVIAVVGNSGQIAVVINGTFQGLFPVAAITRKIVVHGLSGNDRITISPTITTSAMLFGGAGNDMLTGGAGHDVLIGGDGADIIKGRAGRDLLIGGLGVDKLDGGAGDDILVAGMTHYDVVEAALAVILDEWTGNLPYNRRRANLLLGGGLNGTSVFNPAVAPDDRSADKLTGGLGRDWFWAFPPSDKLSDRKSVERIR